MTLGNRIAQLRREMKFSQEYLAEKLNVSRQAVSKWENDQSSPDTENLIALAKLLEVDMAYLANGELTEDMQSDPLPEPIPEPKQEKPKRDHRKLINMLLVLSLVGNVVLFCLWQHEKKDESLMEEFCSSSAAAAGACFADFAHYGTDANYWQGVAQFRAFMTSYNLLRDGNAASYNYLECNVLYTNLVFEKERCENYIEDIRRILRLLSEDKDDPNVYIEMDKLNNEIEHGASD